MYTLCSTICNPSLGQLIPTTDFNQNADSFDFAFDLVHCWDKLMVVLHIVEQGVWILILRTWILIFKNVGTEIYIISKIYGVYFVV